MEKMMRLNPLNKTIPIEVMFRSGDVRSFDIMGYDIDKKRKELVVTHDNGRTEAIDVNGLRSMASIYDMKNDIYIWDLYSSISFRMKVISFYELIKYNKQE